MSEPHLCFVLLAKAAHPDPTEIIAEAGAMGVDLAHEMGDPNTLTFAYAAGGTVHVALMPAPHPDAANMPVGPTSPDPTVVQQHVAHLVVAALQLPEGPLLREVVMGIVTAAVIKATPAVAAMYGHGAIFHGADFFAAMVETSGHQIPTAVTVDITAAQESNDRVSFLTHGLERYGREEFYVTASTVSDGALDYLMSLVDWMVADRDKVLPTGDTVGRTADEKILVQRVPSPIPDRAQVIRLDLDVDMPPEPGHGKKKGFFRRR